MSRIGQNVIGLVSAVALLAGPIAAEDWPQWRGENRDGKSPETGLLQEWPEGGPPLVWQAEGVGAGFSTVTVTGGRLFTMGDIGEKQHVLALSEADGSILWKTEVGRPWEDDYPGPRSTPTVDGEYAYVVTTGGEVVALDTATGAEKWRRNLPNDYDGQLMLAMGSYQWRFSESPLVDGSKLIVTPGHRDAALVALDKLSGEELWRTSIPRLGDAGKDGAGYSSVVVSEACGRRQYVQLIGRGVIGVDAETGEFLWGYNRVANKVANIATPIISGNYVFASTGYRTGAALLEIVCDGDAIEAKEVYFIEPETFQNHHGGMILHEGIVYTGTGHNKGFPIAIALEDGAVKWGPIRNDGKNSAAIAYADGRLYMRYQDGLVLLVEATPGEYVEHGSFRLPDPPKPSWPHPVITGGRLYLREQDRLYAYDVSAQGSDSGTR